MINFNELRQKEHITTGEALLVTQQLCQKYIGVLDNIIRIKSQAPLDDEETFFRAKRDNTALLESLRAVLYDLQEKLVTIEAELTEANQGRT